MQLPRLTPAVAIGVDELGVLGAGAGAVKRDVEGRARLEDGRSGEIPEAEATQGADGRDIEACLR